MNLAEICKCLSEYSTPCTIGHHVRVCLLHWCCRTVLPDGAILHHFLQKSLYKNDVILHACVQDKFSTTPSKNWCNFKRFNSTVKNEILLNLIRKMKYLRDQFQLCFCFCIVNIKQLYFRQRNQHSYRQPVTYALFVFALRYLISLQNEYSVMLLLCSRCLTQVSILCHFLSVVLGV